MVSRPAPGLDGQMRVGTLRLVLIAATLLSLAGCDSLLGPKLATPLPAAFVPTAIAMTLQAKGIGPATFTPPAGAVTGTLATKGTSAPPVHTPTALKTATATHTLTVVASPSPTSSPTLTFTPTLLPTLPITTTPTVTPFPQIPAARAQIYKYGELSMVVSPLQVTAYLTSRVGKVVRFELYGEDGRLLARQMKVFNDLPWYVATVNMNLEFEISGAAEKGRLVVSVEDAYGRMIDVNSVNLILLSTGVTELNPAGALQEAIVIQEPAPKSLIIGGAAYITGIAKPNSSDPLKIVLIAQDGRILGQRLAAVTIPTPGGYGVFAAQVTYTVSEITPALLVVYESGGIISQYAHLTSIDVVLSP